MKPTRLKIAVAALLLALSSAICLSAAPAIQVQVGVTHPYGEVYINTGDSHSHHHYGHKHHKKYYKNCKKCAKQRRKAAKKYRKAVKKHHKEMRKHDKHHGPRRH